MTFSKVADRLPGDRGDRLQPSAKLGLCLTHHFSILLEKNKRDMVNLARNRTLDCSRSPQNGGTTAATLKNKHLFALMYGHSEDQSGGAPPARVAGSTYYVDGHSAILIRPKRGVMATRKSLAMTQRPGFPRPQVYLQTQRSCDRHRGLANTDFPIAARQAHIAKIPEQTTYPWTAKGSLKSN